MSTEEIKWEWSGAENEGEIGQLWQEYQYRHDHVWKTVFMATFAIIALSVVPYLDAASNIGAIAFMPPFFGGLLGVYAIDRMIREFRLLDPVKTAYLGKTREGETPNQGSRFKSDTIFYLSTLMVGAFIHFYLLVTGTITL